MSSPRPPRSRRQFLRTAAATAVTGLTAAVTGCNARNLLSGVDVHLRTLAVDSPPIGLVKTGVWLVAAGRDGRVVGMDPDDGEVQWATDTVAELQAPPVGRAGRVYVAGTDGVGVDGGSERWRTSLPGVASALTVDSDTGTVTVGTEGGHVVAVDSGDGAFVDADDGERVWEARLTESGRARVDALASRDGVVYAGSRDGVTVAFDAQSGEVRWRVDAAASAVAPAGADVLLGRRRVHGVRGGDSDGDVAWSHDTGTDWTTGMSVTTQTAGARWVLVGNRTRDGYALALSGDGERLWRERLTGRAAALTAVRDGRFAVGVEGERPGVQQFTTDGDAAWFFETDTSVVDVVFGGNRVWAVTASGNVVGLSG
jgi:outer membrane protein assembly factor BamB